DLTHGPLQTALPQLLPCGAVPPGVGPPALLGLEPVQTRGDLEERVRSRGEPGPGQIHVGEVNAQHVVPPDEPSPGRPARPFPPGATDRTTVRRLAQGPINEASTAPECKAFDLQRKSPAHRGCPASGPPSGKPVSPYHRSGGSRSVRSTPPSRPLRRTRPTAKGVVIPPTRLCAASRCTGESWPREIGEGGRLHVQHHRRAAVGRRRDR